MKYLNPSLRFILFLNIFRGYKQKMCNLSNMGLVISLVYFDEVLKYYYTL